MQNPFKYGEVVKGSTFIDREKECKDLLGYLEDGLKCFLISLRRIGKTSLIYAVIEKLKRKGYLVAYIDLYGLVSLEQTAASIVRAYAESFETKTEKIWRFIKETIPQLRPVFSIEPDGKFSVTVDVKEKKDEIYNTLNYLFNLPKKLKKDKNKPYVVIYDEFQEIIHLGGLSIEKQLRSAVQTHTGVGYLFSGSQKRLMIEMTSQQDRAFYKIGPTYFLEKIPPDIWFNYIKHCFETNQYKIEKEAIDLIIEIAENIPYYVQYLSYEVWNLSQGNKIVNPNIIHQAVDSICKKQSPLYAYWWDSLTIPQKQLLRTIAVNGGKNVFSNEFLSKCKLPSATLQKSIKLLLNKEILDKKNNEYIFTDVWFMEWIKQLR